MDFVNEFVVSFGRKCVDLVHKYGKKAYVFYDDHWIGIEPYSPRFKDFNFDGLIKCVFNAFEARKCAGVTGVETHELRLHPYLFPTGLKGEPTFKEGGDPTQDAKNFWVKVRRALLRASTENRPWRYLHLVKDFPTSLTILKNWQMNSELLKVSTKMTSRIPFGKGCGTNLLGRLRTWICSGHMHEQPHLDLTM